MDAYPLFLKLKDRSCLLVGGGEVAARKAELLLRAGARLTVVADALSAELAAGAAAGRLDHVPGSFSESQLHGQTLVIAATDGDEALARRVSDAAQSAGLPVNVVDRPSLSTFIAGALVDRSPVLVAISTGGTAPLLAREIRLAIERLLPSALGRLARFAERFRAAARAIIPGAPARRRFWEDFFRGPIARVVLAGDESTAQAAMLSLVNRLETRQRALGIVHIVGAGPGDPDLLTLRALRLLGEADVIVYDELIDPDVLERARRDAERIYVGKSKGRHGRTQDEINALLAALAAAGKRVVRLESGDPFIFGRGGEELEYLRARDVAVEVVPGISAALGCAAALEIPLTHRALSSAVTFVAGHGPSGEPELDRASLARGRETLVIHMGISTAERIAHELIAHGLSGATPVVVVENGTRSNQRAVAGTLAELGLLVAHTRIEGPALIIIGEVARLATLERTLGLAGQGDPLHVVNA